MMPEFCYQDKNIKCLYAGVTFCVSPCSNCFVNKEPYVPEDIEIIHIENISQE